MVLFFPKLYLKIKLDFFLLKWAMVESGAKEIILFYYKEIILEKKLAAALAEKLKNMFKIKKWSSNDSRHSERIWYN